MHQFEDIGRPGFIRVRERSCHRCKSCWEGNSERCSTITMLNYPSRILELKPVTTPQRSLTRSKLSEEGMTMAATVVPGDFVCCEIDSQQEPWMIGLAETGLIKYEGGEQITWMGRIMAGDLLIWATKLEGSGNIFGATEKRVPIFAEDIRLIKFPMKQLETRTSSRVGRGDKRVFARY